MNKTTLILLAMCLLVACGQSQNAQQSANQGKNLIKSAHYFSSAWPKTFWQEFEQSDVAAELSQIKADGFNTIVLTVPWRGFELGFEANQTRSNPLLYQRLEFMLKSISEQDLKFILRLGFLHDYTANTGTDGKAQCFGIFTDKKMQTHWLDYLKKINQVVLPFSTSSAGVIVSWEDFWCPHFVFPNMNEQKRLELAQAMQYGDWLKQRNRNFVKVLLQLNNINFDQVMVPKQHELSYVLYLEFIDYMLDKTVLKPTQSVFNNAALEIRVDKFPIKQGDQYTWIGHDLYFDEANHRGTYWAPFWGAENKGELLTAEQSLKNFEHFLKVVSNQGKNTNHVIEQFNFFDNTPYYPNHANIKPDEIDDFLLATAPLLKKYSQGYGVWAYRDYEDNCLFNSSFELGTEGWQVNGSVTLIEQNGSRSLLMETGATISQSMDASKRFMMASNYDQLDLCLVAENDSELGIIVDNGELVDWSVQAGKNCTSISAEPFKKGSATTFTLVAKTNAQIDALNLHGYTQKLGLYDAEGKPAANLPAFRQLNNLVDE